MSMIGEQVKELRYKADIYNTVGSVWELNRAEAKILQELLRKAADTIEALSAKLQATNTERSAEDCGGGWIYCGDGNNLPKEDGFYLVTLTHRITDIADMLIRKAFFNEKRNAFMDYGSAVIAWKPLPKPYHEP